MQSNGNPINMHPKGALDYLKTPLGITIILAFLLGYWKHFGLVRPRANGLCF